VQELDAPAKDECKFCLVPRSNQRMEEAKELYTLKEGTATFKEYVIPSTNKHFFEVKKRGRVLYEGESYQHARSLYQELCEN
jgi:hypothetical protein